MFSPNQFIANLDAIILGFVQGSYGSLTSVVEIFWHLMFTVFLAYYGYKIMASGKFSAPDLINCCIRFIVVLVLATQWGTFFTCIYRLVTDLPADISGQILQAASNSLGAQGQLNSVSGADTLLMQFYDRVVTICSRMTQDVGLQLWIYLYVIAVWIAATAFTAYATMLIVLAKLAVAVILAVGPVFILLLVFHDTRKLFEGWLRTLLNYAIVPIFVYAMLALLLALVTPTLAYLENHSGATDQLMTPVMPFVLATWTATLLLRQVLNISANITGGVSLATMGGWGATITSLKYLGEGQVLAGKGAYAAGTYAKQKYNQGRTALQKALSKNKEASS